MGVLLQVQTDFMSVPDVMQWIDMNRLSCVVTITLDGDREMSIYMEKGTIVYAASQQKGYRLGEYLAKTGTLSEVQVLQALGESRKSGISLTRYLADNKVIGLPALTEVSTSLVKDMFMEVVQAGMASVTVTSPLPDFVLNGPINLQTGQRVRCGAQAG